MKKTSYKVAIVGVTGAVGQEMLKVLERRKFPVGELIGLASQRSAGSQFSFHGTTRIVQVLQSGSFAGVDIALFSAGSERSKAFAAEAVQAGAVVIDNSSALRMVAKVPLVVPEINPEDVKQHQGIIANPNCSTIIMLMPLWPLHQAFGVSHVGATTYQAASGAGARAMEELKEETVAVLQGKDYRRTVIPHRYAFNLFPHNSPMAADGYCEEERKMLRETEKICHQPGFAVNATCVRVPVLRAHSLALNVTFKHEVSVAEAYQVLSQAPGVKVFEQRAQNLWPMPIDASEQDDVLVGRIRKDISQPRSLDLWAVGDQLLKGAALNAVQIAELLI